jgi:hypothetical protein
MGRHEFFGMGAGCERGCGDCVSFGDRGSGMGLAEAVACGFVPRHNANLAGVDSAVSISAF